MHNSQNNAPMNWDNSPVPNNQLLRGTCYGCHAQGGGTGLVSTGTDTIPQVFHTDPLDLAGGNFGYITGIKGSGASDTKGHNISDLTGTDTILYAPPGGIVVFGHDDGTIVNTDELTCAGTNGCHGNRYYYNTDPDYEGITGAHHDNIDGAVDPGNLDIEPGHSYRFLLGVKGFEDPDWQYTKTSANHNEYYAIAIPQRLGCGVSATAQCHNAGGIRPPDGTMSQYCAGCHGNFHTLEASSSNGIGLNASNPFIRHPTDLSLPATGEYISYITYDLQAPIARIVPPAASSSTVNLGDAVMCLSCHASHGSDYPDILRWDYTTMIAGNGGAAAGTGCFICHTTKD